MDVLNKARNRLNIVVLDACRDLPHARAISRNRGLAFINLWEII